MLLNRTILETRSPNTTYLIYVRCLIIVLLILDIISINSDRRSTPCESLALTFDILWTVDPAFENSTLNISVDDLLLYCYALVPGRRSDGNGYPSLLLISSLIFFQTLASKFSKSESSYRRCRHCPCNLITIIIRILLL